MDPHLTLGGEAGPSDGGLWAQQQRDDGLFFRVF